MSFKLKQSSVNENTSSDNWENVFKSSVKTDSSQPFSPDISGLNGWKHSWRLLFFFFQLLSVVSFVISTEKIENSHRCSKFVRKICHCVANFSVNGNSAPCCAPARHPQLVM